MKRAARFSAAASALGVFGAFGVVGVLCLASLLAQTALAQPASSERSTWTNLPLSPDPALDDALLQRGREVFHARCIACHGPIPERLFGAIFLPPMPGTQALQTRYRGEVPAELDRRTDLTPAMIETVVRKGLNAMPFFRPTEVSRDDLEALIAYLTRERN